MSEDIRLTIIGAGNIGGATAIGLAGAADITATAKTEKTLKKFEGLNIHTSTDNNSAVTGADIVIFAVKPWLMEEVVTSVLPSLDLKTQIIVSMAPGIVSADFIRWLGPSVKLAYAIPNIAIEVGESMTFIVPITTGEDETKRLVDLFSHAGKAVEVAENQLIAGTSLASCGIAYALRYISAASKGGSELGFSDHDAEIIVEQTVKGASAILRANGISPEEAINRVTTPGGLTLRGLNAMEDAGFTESVIRGLKAN